MSEIVDLCLPISEHMCIIMHIDVYENQSEAGGAIRLTNQHFLTNVNGNNLLRLHGNRSNLPAAVPNTKV